jgi:cell division protein FtsL
MSITLLEFVSVFGAIGLALIGGYISIRVAVAKIETRVTTLEKEIEEEKKTNKENFKLMMTKLDEIKEDIHEINVKIGSR